MSKRHPIWVTLALDLLDFHEQQVKEFGQTNSGRPAGDKDGWSIRNTAESQRLSLGKCHNLLTVARAIKKNSMIAQASSFNAAVRLAKKELS